ASSLAHAVMRRDGPHLAFVPADALIDAVAHVVCPFRGVAGIRPALLTKRARDGVDPAVDRGVKPPREIRRPPLPDHHAAAPRERLRRIPLKAHLKLLRVTVRIEIDVAVFLAFRASRRELHAERGEKLA